MKMKMSACLVSTVVVFAIATPSVANAQDTNISSYLEDPKDAVKISAQFAQLPDGTNHVSTMIVSGVSKELTVNTQNSDYQKL